MSKQQTLEMTVSLDVLQHLGINLYSNVPAVLAEIVANAWDADASRVEVKWCSDGDRIVIEDDGDGMARKHVVERFLRVGYQRRKSQPGVTKKGRSPMGRKGIGKLSLFSIADDIVVETVRDGEATAMRMRLDKIKEAIKDGHGKYEPEELDPSDKIPEKKGTRIILSELRKRQTARTDKALRQRLARRFSIIGPNHNFEVKVNDEPISPEDRGYLNHLQYIWTYGDQKLLLERCNALEKQEKRKFTHQTDMGKKITVDGWLGTVHKSGQLKDDLGENLNRIAIFVRGKMAQEDLLRDLAERGVYANYLIGELRVDGLDTAVDETNQDEDSATTSRQRILEDDPRYVALTKFIREELKVIGGKWSKLRTEAGARTAMDMPEIEEWSRKLPPETAKKARRWIGEINRLGVEGHKRKELIKQAVLAFEFYHSNENLAALEEIKGTDKKLEFALKVFRDLDDLELALYGKIVQQRVAVVRTLKEKVAQNEKEILIQKYVFNHLWLLDPAWERIEATELMETKVGDLFKEINKNLPENEKTARVDIKYRKTSGKHVVIELKRPRRKVSVHDLAKQINKYRSGMRKLLENMGLSNEPVEFVCLLGEAPNEWSQPEGQKIVEDTLQALNARFVTYDQLLENAFRAYSDYLKKSKSLSRLEGVMRAIDDDTNRATPSN